MDSDHYANGSRDRNAQGCTVNVRHMRSDFEVRSGPVPQAGDVVIFEQCGAYHAYTPGDFLNLQPARKYLLS